MRAGQPADRERQDQVDERDLDEPAGDAPRAVHPRRRRLREGRQKPGEAGQDEQAAEARRGRMAHGVEPDGDRNADRRRRAPRPAGRSEEPPSVIAAVSVTAAMPPTAIATKARRPAGRVGASGS